MWHAYTLRQEPQAPIYRAQARPPHAHQESSSAESTQTGPEFRRAKEKEFYHDLQLQPKRKRHETVEAHRKSLAKTKKTVDPPLAQSRSEDPRLRGSRTNYLWEGLRRVYYDEKETEPDRELERIPPPGAAQHTHEGTRSESKRDRPLRRSAKDIDAEQDNLLTKMASAEDTLHPPARRTEDTGSAEEESCPYGHAKDGPTPPPTIPQLEPFDDQWGLSAPGNQTSTDEDDDSEKVAFLLQQDDSHQESSVTAIADSGASHVLIRHADDHVLTNREYTIPGALPYAKLIAANGATLRAIGRGTLEVGTSFKLSAYIFASQELTTNLLGLTYRFVTKGAQPSSPRGPYSLSTNQPGKSS
jgi:hypothetical protein